ncbi:hypothetical protein Q7P37_002629 [Cladosporium fusiforme]
MSSLQHILSADPDESSASPAKATPPPATKDMPPPPTSQPLKQENAAPDTPNAGENGTPNDNGDEPMYTSTTTSTRRNASGSVSSVYSGNKIRHLKKEDGIPFWRKDIQYDFLKLVFYDQTKCFSKYSDGSSGFTFAEIYIDAMAKSSKCSKILKEKLLQDTEGAISMAMVCLLVNVGRMNTTLNFFPEMRAQLRTYHSIPALQAHQDPNAYKQLQDAPRLKSILKGATEDDPQPSTLEEIKASQKPRTNPVNLIFVLAQFAPKISETHFIPPRDFYDLVMRGTLSSASRARAFLWLVWWYLESDFSLEDAQKNPFGPGQYGENEEATGALPLKVPDLESLTEEQAALENLDTEDEQHFGEVKRKERIAILASEPSPAMTALKRARKEKGLTSGSGQGYRSEDEGSEVGWYSKPNITSAARHAVGADGESVHTKSPSPAIGRGFQAVNSATKHPQDMRINTLLNNDEASHDGSPSHSTPVPVKKGPGRGNWRRNKKTDGARAEGSHPVPLLPNNGSMFVNETPGAAVPATPGSGYSNTFGQGSPQRALAFQPPNTGDHVPTPSYQAQKRHRGVTQHQNALINHRRQQIDYTLDRRIRKIHIRARDKREEEGAFFRAWKRIKLMPSDYDSEEEMIKSRKTRDRTTDKDDEHRRSTKDASNNADEPARSLLAGFVRVENEASDLGEEAKFLARSLRMCSRRLDRWQDASMPGDAVLRSRARQRNGLLYAPRISGVWDDGPDEDEAPPMIAVKKSAPKPRKSAGGGRGKGKARLLMPVEDVDVTMEDDAGDDEGGGDADDVDGDGDGGDRAGGGGADPALDEEDRELLGEVDADESEDQEDEDETMADE